VDIPVRNVARQSVKIGRKLPPTFRENGAWEVGGSLRPMNPRVHGLADCWFVG